jgi:hypothetical protein
MYDQRSESDARRFGILDRMQALENDLCEIKGIIHVEFDIRGYNEFRQVILIPKYDILAANPDYFAVRRLLLQSIFNACEKHGLRPSGDTVEDMGEHLYIVRTCDSAWPKAA